MFGLYDTDGILRFIGADKEACLAYAELFEMPTSACSLMSLPETEPQGVKSRKRVRLAMSNN